MMLQDRASEFDDIDAHVEVDDGQSFLPHHLNFSINFYTYLIVRFNMGGYGTTCTVCT